ncbi:MAG: glycerophosphodiester phosphodiesterase family protein, partial [Gammaproteobacteria bacterium]
MNEQMRNLFLAIIIVVAAGVAAPCLAELVVHLEMEGDLSDAGGGDQNGVLVDGPDGTNAYVTGVMGLALDLGHVSSDPGTTGNDYVEIPYIMPDQGSLALWYHTADYYQYQTIFDNSVQADDWEMWIYDDGRVRFRVQSGTEVTADLDSLASDNDGQGKWWHIALTWARDGSSVDTQMYVNGELINQNNGPWVAPGASVFLGGGSSGNDAGIGIWDEVQIYNHVLSDTEVRAMVPRRALVMNPDFLSLTEGQSNTYTVALDYTSSEEPSAEVTVTIICPPELSLNHQPAGTDLPLSFQQGNYQDPQTVTVKVIDDDINQGNRNIALLHSAGSGDISWNVVEDYYSVNIFDDDLGCGAWGYAEMDFNSDCYVNIIDFALFAEQWLDCTHPSGMNCRQMQDVLVVAHRGYSVAAPENTIASCNAARGFADMVEFDVRDTADGYLILMHDATVDRTTDGIGSVPSMTFNELRALDAGSWFSPEYAGEMVPLMSEAILA